LDLPTFQQLLTPLGQQAITVAAALNPTEETFLACFTKLEKQYPAELAKAALETVIFRRKAAAKFSRAGAMYFTRDGLEMASGEIISGYRGQRYAAYEFVLDLGCGIGGDTIGLASPLGTLPQRGPMGRQVQGAKRGITAFDLNPLHLAIAEQNLAAYDLKATFIHADLNDAPLPSAEAAFFDPGRRAGGRRRFSVRDYEPPLERIHTWLPSLKTLGVKISPGVDLSEIEGYESEVEFISVKGDLKECVLWFGEAKTAVRRATLLLPNTLPITFAPFESPSPATLSEPLGFLYEPDPSILRAGLVTHLAAQLNAAQMDSDIAYLTSATLAHTPFARAFAVEAHMPFSQKRLREKLRAMKVGQVIVKKRGSPLDPAEFARSLKLKGDEERIVFLTHVQGKPWILIGTELTADKPS
jgi:SAM-dependent methyltransferase